MNKPWKHPSREYVKIRLLVRSHCDTVKHIISQKHVPYICDDWVYMESGSGEEGDLSILCLSLSWAVFSVFAV